MTFSLMTLITAIVLLGLSLGLVFAPAAMLRPWGLDNPTAASVLSRRIGAIYLGLAVMMFLARSGDAQTAIAIGAACVTGFLALIGANELRLGTVSKGILGAMILETLLTAGFLSTLGA